MKFTLLLFSCLISFCVQAELYFTSEMIDKHLASYTKKEVELIKKDLSLVRSICFDTNAAGKKFYLATAGSPGARKSTILEKFLEKHPEYQTGTYLDPNVRTLRYMAHTYYAKSLNPLMVAQSDDYTQVIKNAYEKWRDGSNYITYTLFEEAIANKQSIIHGTTSTKPYISEFLAKLKAQDYQIVLLLCSAPSQVRLDAVKYRNREIRFYQSSLEDVISKGKLFPERMQAYFTYADVLYFYWSDSLFSPERLAAIWQKGKLEVLDKDAMQKFIQQYELDREDIVVREKRIPHFESFLLDAVPK